MKSTKWQPISLTLGRGSCAFASVLFLTTAASAVQIYTINAGTNFGTNTANAGAGPTFSDTDTDGFFELAHAADSGNNNAIYIDSSDGNAAQTINSLAVASTLGRGLQVTDTVIVSGSVAPTDFAGNFYDSVANGFEMGIHSIVGFRANPNLLIQLRSTNQASGTPAFFEYVANNDPGSGAGAGVNARNNSIPALLESSLNDGFSFSVAYSATNITFTATDVIDFGTGTPTSVAYTFTHGTDTTSSGGTTGFDFLSDVGDGYAYFSQQKWSAGMPAQSMEFSAFQVDVVPAIPEPSSAITLALGGFALLFRRRRA